MFSHSSGLPEYAGDLLEELGYRGLFDRACALKGDQSRKAPHGRAHPTKPHTRRVPIALQAASISASAPATENIAVDQSRPDAKSSLKRPSSATKRPTRTSASDRRLDRDTAVRTGLAPGESLVRSKHLDRQ